MTSLLNYSTKLRLKTVMQPKKRKCISVTIDLKKKSGKAYQLTVKHGYREHAFNK